MSGAVAVAAAPAATALPACAPRPMSDVRQAVLDQLVAERYGDIERLSMERHDRTHLTRPVVASPPCQAINSDAGNIPPERPEVLAGRRFLLLRGMADAHPTAGTWRRQQPMPVSAHPSGRIRPNVSTDSAMQENDCGTGDLGTETRTA